MAGDHSHKSSSITEDQSGSDVALLSERRTETKKKPTHRAQWTRRIRSTVAALGRAVFRRPKRVSTKYTPLAQSAPKEADEASRPQDQQRQAQEGSDAIFVGTEANTGPTTARARMEGYN